MRWGDFDLHLVSDGKVWLDGGAMFGIVPKTLWSRKTTPDEENRIPLGLNCLLVRGAGKNILIDTGCGYKYTDKELRIYRIDHQPDLLSELRRFEVNPENVDLVINTHLHFDHCGGNTTVRGDEIVPTFPNAEYVIRQREYEDACEPNERTRATYFQHNWEPIAARGRLRIVDGDEEIVPGVQLVATPGHTPGHQSVKIHSGGKTLFYIADLCPTQAHVPLPWIMGYDLHPMTTLETRKRIYRTAVAEDWLLFFEHDPDHPTGRLRHRDRKFVCEPEPWRE